MTISPRPNWTLALGLPLLVFITCTIIVFSPLFALNISRISTAVALDLTVTAPLLYFLVIRKTGMSRVSVIRVFTVGALAAGLLLGHRNPLLHGIRTWISPVVETVVIAAVVWKIRQVRRQTKGGASDVLTQARYVMSAVAGNQRVGDILGSEIAVFYYAFAARRTKDGFSYARASGALPVLGVFMMAMIAEGVGLHFLIAHWSPMTAWILTGLSMYTLLQLYAHMRAMKARPIRVVDGMLYLRNGLAADVCVRIDDIEEVTLTTRTVRGDGVLKLALFGVLEGHTMCIRLRQPMTVVRMFGIRRNARVLLFAVDRPEELLMLISQ
ncbi:MAG: hypothetical protein J0H74_18770 [Chitinophagaceae bacterium]|nr:hypothetical protein [Chitinophagaceae bacterium]